MALRMTPAEISAHGVRTATHPQVLERIAPDRHSAHVRVFRVGHVCAEVGMYIRIMCVCVCVYLQVVCGSYLMYMFVHTYHTEWEDCERNSRPRRRK